MRAFAYVSIGRLKVKEPVYKGVLRSCDPGQGTVLHGDVLSGSTEVWKFIYNLDNKSVLKNHSRQSSHNH